MSPGWYRPDGDRGLRTQIFGLEGRVTVRSVYRRVPLCMLGIALGLLLMGAVAGVHPQDGAHADIRISITDQEVVFSVIMNLAFIDEVCETPREDPGALDPVEEPGVRDALENFYRTQNRVSIDGVDVSPTFGEFEVSRPGTELLPLFPITGMRGLIRVRQVVHYSAKSSPKQVSMVWGGYPPDMLAEIEPGQPRPPLALQGQLSAEGVVTMIDFTQAEPEYTWHASGLTADERFMAVPAPPTATNARLCVPVVLAAVVLVVLIMVGVVRHEWGKGLFITGGLATVVLVGGVGVMGMLPSWLFVPLPGVLSGTGLPSDEEALAVFHPLHSNIYRAFDYSTESDIYDALARSVDGELLDSLYNDVYRSLIMQEHGGAVSRVKSVTPMEESVQNIGLLPPDDRVGFQVLYRWQVEGEVYHWGHTHTRVNQYQAEYTVVSSENGWRIAGSNILEQFRVDADPFPTTPAEVPAGDEMDQLIESLQQSGTDI
ncbi:MAG: hypothetical protein D8M59_03380 [Planctomycetes bacterium]|nr:hypothetical protein [Planctomycetota bacterium]